MRRSLSAAVSRFSAWSAVCVLINTISTMQWALMIQVPGTGAVSVLALGPNAKGYAELDSYEADDLPVPFIIPSYDLYSRQSDIQIHAASSVDPPAHNHTDWCKFRKEDYIFDLCPLLAPEIFKDKPNEGENGGKKRKQSFVKRIEVRKDTPPTVTHTHYYISLRGKLDMRSERWKGRECPDGTWVCAIVVNFENSGEKETDMRLLQIIPIAGNLPLEDGHTREAHLGLNVSARLGPKQKTARHRELHIILHGGMYASKNQSALLRFQCNHTAEPSSLEHSWTYNGFHVFTWASKHACASRLNAPVNPAPNDPDSVPEGSDSTPETPPDDTPADSGGGGDDGYGSGGGGPNDDFVLPENGGGLPNRQWWRAGIASVLWILALTLCSFYVLYALFPRLRILVHTYIPLPSSALNVLRSIPHPTMPSSISSSLSSLSQKVAAISKANPFGSKRGKYRYGRDVHGGFRPDERRLRFWAQEEGVLLDSGSAKIPSTEDMDFDLGGEEDFMINAGSSSLVDNNGQRGSQVRSYGSVSRSS